jgi:hypothetical protein
MTLAMLSLRGEHLGVEVKMEAVRSSETLVYMYHAEQRHISENIAHRIVRIIRRMTQHFLVFPSN